MPETQETQTEKAPVENVINFDVVKDTGTTDADGNTIMLDQDQAVEKAQELALKSGYNKVSLQNETATAFKFLGYNR